MQRRALAARGAVVIAVLASLLVAPASAHAYCVSPGHAIDFHAQFPSLRIPVYLSIAANSTIEQIGLGHADAARILIEVIARHNETAIAPKLYFAGFDATDFVPLAGGNTNSFQFWPQGITVYSYPCELLAPENDYVPKQFLCNASSQQGVKACATYLDNGNAQITGLIGVVPTECELAGPSKTWTLDGSSDHDLAHTLLHELGHVIGLEHTNRTPNVCMAGGHVAGNLANPQGNTGVMRTTNGASLSMFRHWRRDDLDGLDALWGGVYPSYELAYWSDDSFPAFPAVSSASSLAGAAVIRSASMSSSTLDEVQALVSVDDTRHVSFATLAANGAIMQAPAVIEPGLLGVTAGSAELALDTRDDAHARAFVAWTALEQPHMETMQTRWAVRELPAGPWSLTAGFELATSRVVAGFDPDSEMWLLGTLSNAGHPQLSVIDDDGALLLEAASLGQQVVYEISNPICGHDDGCTMLVSTSELGGPSLGRIDFSIDSDPLSVVVASSGVFEDQDVYGRVALAPSGPALLRGVAGWRHFELGTDDDAPLDPEAPPLFSLRDWPLGLGAHVKLEGALSHRLARPLEVVCGNGIMQANEQCDDGNLQANDGCDGTCMIELLAGDTGDTEDSSDSADSAGMDEGTGTGGAGLDPLGEDGCNCALRASSEDLGRDRGLLWINLSGCALLAWRRRRATRRPGLAPRTPAARAGTDQSQCSQCTPLR